ncbi:pyruvate transporter MPC1 NDAI_0I01170 [Naumovozyma dairenensis CBS 421]|uniref:Mitochondrial pyruvate carrier n=1 Tax=Naumovozyma dairenensis (strain ATCC 10597 / BCRC 20456 / CBS 421 / NBRC 0211 / NRRL Y-12639) TaxID=1071378 RepID=G0WFX5_NAUDC|nr:hypothetical protein NDAI_0I01170 [Naumovozyma dairenensis CBS 421]CCD26686.1 hypothetical protein NDAI_0I01170 [Naumovozyma dairenensis CBS 421]
MTLALVVYSGVFMKYTVAVTPKNYLLFGCHFINEGAQLMQGFRFIDFHYFMSEEQQNEIHRKHEMEARQNETIKEE